MPKQASKDLEATGTVLKALGNNNYVVELEVDGKKAELSCYLAGKMCQHAIKVIPGDLVKVVVPPPYTKGRITFRNRAAPA